MGAEVGGFRYLHAMLRFRLLGIPVGVHASFLFVALIGPTSSGVVVIAVWTLAALVSILLHELGHALVARSFGAHDIDVTLYGLGGLTSYRHDRQMSHGRSFVVSAAGSLVGIISGGVVWLLRSNGVFVGIPFEAAVFVNSFVFTSLIWGALNWIPIVPLDGGHMAQHLVAMVNEEKAPLIGQIVTWLTVAIVVPYAWINGYRFGVLIVILFAVSGLREYRDQVAAHETRTRPPPDPKPAPPADPTPPKRPPEFPI